MNDDNQLDVDPAALAREADAVPLPDTTEPGADAPGAPIPPAATWAPVTPGIVAGVDLFVCPAWKLSDAEKTALAEALAPALDQAFPGGLGDEKWAPWFRLLVVVGGIAATRYDRDTGKLAPLRAKPEPKPGEEGAPPVMGAGFSTGSDANQ